MADASVVLTLIHLAALAGFHEALDYPVRFTVWWPWLFGYLVVAPLVNGIVAVYVSRLARDWGPALSSPTAVPRPRFALADLLLVLIYTCVVLALLARVRCPLWGSPIARNETHACAMLKCLVSTESTWRQTDSDGNGVLDYWTLDVAAFYGMKDKQGTRLEFIDRMQADADLRPETRYEGQPRTPRAWDGYLYRAMEFDEAGRPYAAVPLDLPAGLARPDESVRLRACHSTKYGFCAVPEVYDVTGIRTIIVNEEGVMYGVDTGSNVPVLQWPGTDPTSSTVNGRNWNVIK
ncbi:MAG: hypothetical protein HYY93_16800 [Planctomycetes bacterium]|nr:hypothetical protein [Planctomycetota bacterium]